MTYKREETIGDCRLILGDCLQVMPIGGGNSMVTDPPYGMAFQSNYRHVQHAEIANDGNEDLLKWACGMDRPHSKYIFCRWDNLASIPKPKSFIKWIKNNHSMGDLEHEHARQTEEIAFYPGSAHRFPKKRPTDVIYGARTRNDLHPTEKPVDVMAQVVEWTEGIVFDPFMGSGATGVACVKLGRKFIGIEISERYFNIACRRIQDAYDRPDIFISHPQKAEQLTFAEVK